MLINVVGPRHDLVMAEALVLGCAASGKTLLVRQLRSVAAQRGAARNTRRGKKKGVEVVSLDTRATVGVEIDQMVNSTLTLREVGSAMAPMWPAFFQACACLIFVVDASNAAQLPEAAVELWSLLGAAVLEQTPVLVVLSKSDMPAMLSQDEVLAYLRLEDARKAHGARLDVAAASLVERESCVPILDWIEGNCAPTKQ